ncbi:sulfate reduction electron transfer complex DsrMKJOP subunit DsrO [Novispirillum sp. DQ9]|uniref:sulfate reduction electron transfer complex DsrMKJOP subunit DsrO n=1 Tax=Novispirillum sp. DQ9 TaxID=3398612 RepID=UPI003C7D039F
MTTTIPETTLPETTRRTLLKAGAAVVAAGTLAPGITLIAPAAQARAPGEAANPRQRWGLLIDATKCAEGCDKCVTACNTEMGLPDHGRDATDPQYIRIVTVRDPETEHAKQLPVMCQHCENPPCVDVCPTTASFKRADGIVLVDRHRCIGCRYCMMACPYKARSFAHEVSTEQKPHNPRGKGCVESCTLCAHRVDAGRQPACVETCPTGAMLFGDLNDPDSAISRKVKEVATSTIRGDLGTKPGVHYVGL